MPKPERYRDLLSEVSRIYESTVQQSQIRHMRNKTRSYLEIGQCISGFIEAAEQGSGYGKQVVSKLSEDLTKKYGSGLGPRTIRYMRKFAENYQPQQVSETLGWSHYCILLSITDPQLRSELEKKAISKGLNRDELQNLVSFEKQKASNTGKRTFPLTPRDGRLKVYKVIVRSPKDAPQLDVGFGVSFVPGGHTIQSLSHGTLVTPQKNGHYKVVTCERGARYCYKGRVLRVIDGDTVLLQINIAPNMYVTERFRLRGLNAMERDIAAGEKATHALKEMLKGNESLIILTYGNDRYGRYIADLVTEDGVYINQQMVEQGHARYLAM